MTATLTRRLRPLLLSGVAMAFASAALGAQAREGRTGPEAEAVDRDEDGQRSQLPTLPKGMTLEQIRQGDALFRGKGGCVTCHGPEATGMPLMGSSLTAGLHFIPYEWSAIDSVIRVGIPEPVTRPPNAMPPRGASSNLTDEETRTIAAYVWAISQVRGEPWPGGHQVHEGGQAAAARQGSQRQRQPQ